MSISEIEDALTSCEDHIRNLLKQGDIYIAGDTDMTYRIGTGGQLQYLEEAGFWTDSLYLDDVDKFCVDHAEFNTKEEICPV